MLALKVHGTRTFIRYIGAYAMELGGLDALAFTGGIGENSARLRQNDLRTHGVHGRHCWTRRPMRAATGERT